jgi:hypothetical protein
MVLVKKKVRKDPAGAVSDTTAAEERGGSWLKKQKQWANHCFRESFYGA